jgi:DNA repair protein RadC
MTDMPVDERPRERLQKIGARALSTAELLAILIETGTRKRNALDVAQSLVCWADGDGASDEGSLRKLLRATFEEICSVEGVGPSKACKIKAALELGRRLSAESGPKTVISSPGDVGNLLMEEMRHLDQEHFRVIHLGVKNQVLGVDLVSVGTVGSSLVHPREVFKNSIRRNATGVILVHNHPSGDPTPSKEDVSVTRRIADAGRILGIEVVDHIVIGDRKFASLRETSTDWNVA